MPSKHIHLSEKTEFLHVIFARLEKMNAKDKAAGSSVPPRISTNSAARGGIAMSQAYQHSRSGVSKEGIVTGESMDTGECEEKKW